MPEAFARAAPAPASSSARRCVSLLREVYADSGSGRRNHRRRKKACLDFRRSLLRQYACTVRSWVFFGFHIACCMQACPCCRLPSGHPSALLTEALSSMGCSLSQPVDAPCSLTVTALAEHNYRLERTLRRREKHRRHAAATWGNTGHTSQSTDFNPFR